MYALPYLVLIRLHRAALDARRRDRTWHHVAWSIVLGATASVIVAMALLATALLWRVGWWPLALAVLAVGALPVLQPLLARHVLVPLGRVRAAFWLAHLATMQDSDAYALCVASWAHAARPTPAGEAWIVARRNRRTPLGDAEVVVTALLAAARGDADTARLLLRSLASVVENHAAVRELAGEWLACDAAERGAWAELAADAAAVRWPASPLTFLLEGIALRRTGGSIGAVDLASRWLVAPHRRSTRALLRALAAPPPGAPPGPPPSPPPDAGRDGDGEPAGPQSTGAASLDASPPPLATALAQHVGLAADAATAEHLSAAVRAWDAALLDRATQTWLARRALELEAPPGAVDRALRDVASAASTELARIAETGAIVPPSSPGPVGDALARRLRHGRLDALEASFTRWADRRRNGDIRAAIDEWREFVALRAAYDAAVSSGGLELRRLAFPHAYTTGTQMAAWLWNTRKEYVISHAISAWLREEAMAVGDTEAIELCTRNCGLAVPTRTGTVR